MPHLSETTVRALERVDHDLSSILELHKARVSAQLLGDDAVLRPDQVAEALGLAPRTLENWRRRGEGPRWREMNGRPVMFLGDLRRWLRETLGSSADTAA